VRLSELSERILDRQFIQPEWSRVSHFQGAGALGAGGGASFCCAMARSASCLLIA
jgi:hypothetical protein